MLSSAIHIFLHFAVPGLVAWTFFRKDFKKAWLSMVATMLVDADHLLATPLFDPMRCSIGFHPLHSCYIQPLYMAMSIYKPTRLIGLGLLIHMLLDALDCLKLI